MLDEVRGQLESCGVDVAGAMERMMGNEDLFFRMMKKFLEDTIFQDLKGKLMEKEYKAAFEYAHALKGVAGNLGLNSIMEADIVIVEKLRHYTAESVQGIEADLEKLENIYLQVCEVLRKL